MKFGAAYRAGCQRLLAAVCCAPLLTLACVIDPPEDQVVAAIKNQCFSDRECPSGVCSESGRCVVADTVFKSLLLQIIPTSSDRVFGGREFFQKVTNLDTAVELDIVLQRPPAVSGSVTLWLAEGCAGHAIDLTLRSRLESLGFTSVRYTVHSESVPVEVQYMGTVVRDFQSSTNPFEFPAVPPGPYDLYLSPGLELPQASCPAGAVPQLIRQVPVADQSARLSIPFDQNTPEPALVEIRVPWNDELEGWVVDMVHNITGEVLSAPATLSAGAVAEPASNNLAVVSLRLSSIVGTDYAITNLAGGTLLRLRPPAGGEGPTLLLAPSGITIQTPPSDDPSAPDQTLQIPLEIGPFSELVQYRPWVWAEGEAARPVAGEVRFSATSLVDISGVVLNYTKTVTIDEEGGVDVALLPGTYNVDVTPLKGLGLGRYRTTIIVSDTPNLAAASPQAGHVIAVPEAPTLGGRVRAPFGQEPVGVAVHATAASRSGLVATAQVRRLSPRLTSDLVNDRGRFAVPLDCGYCSEETPALFDFTIKPPANSGLPWLVYRDVSVQGDIDLGTIELQEPRLYPGTVSFVRSAAGTPQAFPGPLIRAFAMFDRDGALVDDITVPHCSDVPPPVEGQPALPCVQKVLQIAEARADRSGAFELALPTDFQVLQ